MPTLIFHAFNAMLIYLLSHLFLFGFGAFRPPYCRNESTLVISQYSYWSVQRFNFLYTQKIDPSHFLLMFFRHSNSRVTDFKLRNKIIRSVFTCQHQQSTKVRHSCCSQLKTSLSLSLSSLRVLVGPLGRAWASRPFVPPPTAETANQAAAVRPVHRETPVGLALTRFTPLTLNPAPCRSRETLSGQPPLLEKRWTATRGFL